MGNADSRDRNGANGTVIRSIGGMLNVMMRTTIMMMVIRTPIVVMLLLVQMRMRLSPHGLLMRVVMVVKMMPLRIVMTGDNDAMMMMV